ncbi:uncharacterized protein LOC125681198 [Ostrea edulis]|uniref:uncharacterized protein LOC125681198 n=1 Tax=Ostrea edulis TaxID=37623 RepID=UPI002095732A|nr:uncharacterized protein LOC125681198 [Ostrea edulis]
MAAQCSVALDNHQEKEKDREIERLENRLKEYEIPKNVAIIGTPGSGKSSFINSVITSFSKDCWREWTSVGNAQGNFTRHLVKIPKDTYLDTCERKIYPYPTLIDMIGFEDQSTDVIKELLRYVLFGLVPHEGKLINAMKTFEVEGIKGMRKEYLSNPETMKVDCLIFVASATSVLPLNLMDAVKQVALQEERVVPLFGVLTQRDKIINLEEYETKKKEFCSRLGLPNNRFLLCTNYCDDYDAHTGLSRLNQVFPELDVPILSFMRQVCDASIRVLQCNATLQGADDNPPPQRDPPAANPVPPRPSPPPTDVSVISVLGFAIKGLIIAVLLFWILTPPLDGQQMVDACAKFEHKSRTLNFSIPGIEVLCGRVSDVTQRQMIVPLICFVITIVGMDLVMPKIIQMLQGHGI